MGVKVKEVKAKAFINYSTAFFLRTVMRKFTINSLEEMDNLKERIAPVEKAIYEFQENRKDGQAQPSQSDLLIESKICKDEIAYLTKSELGALIAGKGMDMDTLEILSFWLIKD